MILFKNDWDLYPDAIVDVNTRSTSALKLATIYKRMGIKNCAFILQLHNRELSGVDIHNDPSNELKYLVADELSINPWYYFREVAMAPASGGSAPQMFRLNRANVALYWCFFNGLISLLIQARQTGKTLSLDQLRIDLMQYLTTNASLGLFTKNASLRTKNIESMKELMDALPRWLDFRNKKDSNNSEGITVNAQGNRLTTAVAQSTKAAAMNVFRGETKPLLDIDEAAFIVNIDLSLSSMLPAMSAARDNAEASGLPNGVNITTTAGYLDSPSGKYVHTNMYKKAARFSEKLFDLRDKYELRTVIAQNGYGERNSMVLIEMNHRDLGYSDDWLRHKIAESMLTPEQASAEFLLRWNAGKVSSALPKAIIKRLNDNKIEPISVEIRDYGFSLNWYISEEERQSYKHEPIVIGIDSSDAVGNDGIGFVGRNYKTGVVIVVGKFSKANLDDFGLFVYDFMIEFINSVLVIEKRSSATAILDQLAKLLHAAGENIFKRVFNWVVNDMEEKPERYREVTLSPSNRLDSLYLKYKKEFGYGTSGGGKTSRDNLYGRNFETAVSMVAEYIMDRDLVTELTILEKKNGRIDHKYDENDDLCISFLLVHWFLTSGKNLEVYGLDGSLALATVLSTDVDAITNHEDAQKKKAEVSLMSEISDLISSIKDAPNDGAIFRIETKVNSLKQSLGNHSISMNTEAKLKDALAKRRKKQKLDLNTLY